MGEKTMKNLKGAFQGTLAALALATFAAPSHARITVDALGGELEVEGFLKSEVRSRMGSGPVYLGQWIQRLQVEAALNYYDVGMFDELTFVGIIRPEYDIVQDMGDLGSNRIGDGATEPSMQERGTFDFANDPLGFGGFDFVGPFFGTGYGTTSTGGIGKIVSQGLENPSWLAKGFETDFRRQANGQLYTNFGTGGFPLVVQKASNLNLDCRGCTDINVDNLDVAMANTDSNGRLYPFRELYVDAVVDDFWIRLGKQQIVWGKTDFFRLQDLINPVDFGQHFFYDSFEDIRIPQWMLSIQYKAGSIGPLTDNAIQVVWNFDQYQQIGLGNPSHFWAHPFSKDISTFAIYNTYFSPEPCFGPQAVTAAPGGGVQTSVGSLAGTVPVPLSDVCGSQGPNDPRSPAGFGQPVGLNAMLKPAWEIDNTEAGWRWEFRVSDFRFALSHWYGWNDVPVFKFHSVNMPTRFVDGVIPNDVLVGDLALARAQPGYETGDLTALAQAEIRATGTSGLYATGGFVDPIAVVTPERAVQLLSGSNDATIRASAAQALATGNYADFWTGVGRGGACASPTGGIFCSPVAGGQTSTVYKQAHTLGLAMDYFESWSGVVMRIESSWTFNELVNNTRSVDWTDTSDVMRFSLGFDRPTFIPFLNKDRTFFLSLQIFDTWYWDHEGDKNTGYFVDEHNWITTFFFIGNYMRDKLKPVGFYVWEEYSNSHVAGFNLEWLMDNHWSIKGGFHLIWEGDDNMTHDVGPFTNFISLNSSFGQNPYTTSTFGPGRQGIGALRNYDEVFFELKYQF
jgi:hypothetical protein